MTEATAATASTPPGMLEVEICRVRYSAPEGDFAVLDALTPEGEEVILTGALGHLHEGESLRATGEWRSHPRHGRQFAVRRAMLEAPASDRALLSYLSAIKHVGPQGAQWLLERHGLEVLTVIDRDPPRRLREVPGIGPVRLGAAVGSWENQTAVRAVRLFLESHGVEAAVAARVYRVLGAGAVALLRDDPYRLTALEGIGFQTADALARALGTDPDHPSRLDAGILHALAEAESDGHCHLPRTELERRTTRMLSRDPGGRIEALAREGRLVMITDAPDAPVAEAGMHRTEARLARRVRELLDAPAVLGGARVQRPSRGGFTPTDEQWMAVTRAFEHRLSILTGGPGTGKSAAMRALVDAVHARRHTARLCAPTGRAARRLTELTGAPATTIHRLLEWVPGEGFTRGRDHPIEGADLLIVDEASMLDVRLAAALMAAVGERTHVLLVGDVDQLAPVGPGRVLEDLIGTGRVPTTRLDRIFRQAARSMIVRAAHSINRGQIPAGEAEEGTDRDYFFIARTEPGAVFDEVVTLAERRLAAHYGLDRRTDIQVLAPMHRGPVGIEALNTELRARCNPDGESIRGTTLRVGDRVIQTRNDHEHELMNGERGLLVHADQQRETVMLATDDGRRLRLGIAATASLSLAYAISIHKAQGSQAPAVIVPLLSAHRVMLTRNLLYTAITRAERLCVVVGQPEALALAVARVESHRRHTLLAGLISGGVPGRR